ncbi:MAG: hypothetical protein WCC38_02265 [Pseudonocardiaceae bacterium]
MTIARIGSSRPAGDLAAAQLSADAQLQDRMHIGLRFLFGKSNDLGT